MTVEPASGDEQLGRCVFTCARSLVLLLPVFPAVLVYLLSGALMAGGSFKKIAIGLPADPARYKYMFDGSIVGQEMNARYFVLTSLVVLLVASAAATATALWVFYQNFEPLQIDQARNTAALRCIAAASSLALVVALAWVWLGHAPQFHMYVGKDVFPTLVPLYFNGREGFAFDQTFIIQTLPRIASTLSLIPGVCIVVCGCTFLIRYCQAVGKARPTYEEVKSYGLERLARLRILLSVSSALFVAAVLYSKAYLAWPLAVMHKDFIAQYSSAVEGFTTFEGVRFALVLFSLLACMYLAVRWSAMRLTDKASMDKLLAEPGLTFNIPQIMQSTVTVIAPLLVGPVADALKNVSLA